MTFEQIWDQLRSKQPKLNTPDSTVVFGASEFRRLLLQVYDQGVLSGEKNAGPSLGKLGNIFGGIDL